MKNSKERILILLSAINDYASYYGIKDIPLFVNAIKRELSKLNFEYGLLDIRKCQSQLALTDYERERFVNSSEIEDYFKHKLIDNLFEEIRKNSYPKIEIEKTPLSTIYKTKLYVGFEKEEENLSV